MELLTKRPPPIAPLYPEHFKKEFLIVTLAPPEMCMLGKVLVAPKHFVINIFSIVIPVYGPLMSITWPLELFALKNRVKVMFFMVTLLAVIFAHN